jgi:hypothetical protein
MIAETPDGEIEIADDSEVVVISHPLPSVPPPNPQPRHAHHEREVICKAGANEIILEPMLNHPFKHKYVRTTDKDSFGRTIFTEAK